MLIVKTDGAVRILTINRPERRNALGTELMRELRRQMAEAEADTTVRALVLTGSPPAFCAGSDLKELGGLSIEDMQAHEADTAAVARSINEYAKPVIAAIEGYALGGGFILAVSCDVVVSATDARWHLPEVKNGWLPPWGLCALAARVGPVKAKHLTWATDPIDGTEAHQLGVADLLAAPGQAFAIARAHAETLVTQPAGAMRSTKSFYAPIVMPNAERLDELSSSLFGRDCASGIAQTTLRKFKRPA